MFYWNLLWFVYSFPKLSLTTGTTTGFTPAASKGVLCDTISLDAASLVVTLKIGMNWDESGWDMMRRCDLSHNQQHHVANWSDLDI